MTTKQKLFVKEYIDNKGNGTQAALKSYGKPNKPTTYNTAAQIAEDNLKKPQIISALAIHNETIENTILQGMVDYKDSDKQWQRTLAIDTAKWLHDKIHGKATQKTENTSTSLVAHISSKNYNL